MCRCNNSRTAERQNSRAAAKRIVLFRSSALLLIFSAALLLFPGCIQEMADQPRPGPLEANAFFTNGQASRHPVPGTVARGQLQLDIPFFTGKQNGEVVTSLPELALQGTSMPDLLARGQQRFDVFCSHCHGQIGGGTGGSELMSELTGMVVKRGFPAPPTFHQQRLRDAALGHFFDVITNGFGRMPAHGYLIPPEDRWAIVAYIRALQLSQHAEVAQLTVGDLQRLDSTTSTN
jgi:mono/diheme cytochrome c family protein